MFHFFQTFLYQPFFNLLIGIYWMLNQIPNSNVTMGLTVVIFTVIVRILLLPVSLSAYRSEEERRQISKEILELEEKYRENPVAIREGTRKILRRNRRVLVSELFSLFIQVAISLILWAIFSTGLDGKDTHLVYSFMPQIFPIPPEKLTFLGLSLNHPHWQLNLFQSLMIFILETLSTYISPYPVTRGEVVRYQLTLPVISYAIFAFLPAGKKLFVITTLIFSIFLTLFMAIRKKLYDIQERLDRKAAAATDPHEKVVVEVKT